MDFLHTGLVVRDLALMRDFYTKILGFRVLNELDSIAPAGGDHTGFPNARRKLVFLGCGEGHQLELVKYLEPESPEAGCDRHERGSMHVCFQSLSSISILAANGKPVTRSSLVCIAESRGFGCFDRLDRATVCSFSPRKAN